MIPRMAMPSAPPNSALVSDSADAAPARSGGAAPTTRSVARVSTGASASEKTTDPVTRSARPAGPSRVNSHRPAAPSAMQAAMTKAGRNRRASTRGSKDPRADAGEEGSIHNPPASGGKPHTSRRDRGMEKKGPDP